MKVAVEWLRSFGEFTSLSDSKLAETLTMAGLEVEEIHGAGADLVFVTKVTPNRGDWLSIFGVARELAAASSLPLNVTTTLTAYPAASSIDGFSFQVDDPQLCPRFATAVLHNVKSVPSPDFIQQRLALSGMRPLNAIVDITNYVMLEVGQPLHAYDIAKLNDKKIIVRRARHGETIQTLDGAEHQLSEDFLVIADSIKPIGIAGIMGGLDSEVTDTTSTIVLEAAHFDPGVVRRGAKRFGYSTEASFRFERYVDPSLVPIALARAADLLVQYAGATVEPHIIDSAPNPIGHRAIRLRPSRTNQLLGLSLSADQIASSLRRLAITVTEEGDVLNTLVPTFRPDLVKEIDLIEEVGRMIGYWNLPETVPPLVGQGGSDFDRGAFDSKLRTILVGQGLYESYSHTLGAVSYFDNPDDIKSRRVNVRSSLSNELSGLRLTLLPHLLDALALNLRQGISPVRLFEVGKIFLRPSEGTFDEPRHVAGVLTGSGIEFSTAKGVVENLLNAIGVRNAEFELAHVWGLHAGRTANIIVDGDVIGYVGELDPYAVDDHLELPPSTGRITAFEIDAEKLRVIASHVLKSRYVPLPKFPSVTRDIALVYDLDVPYGAIEKTARYSSEEILESVSLLSVYTGERIPTGKKSVAIRLTLRSRSKTLTEPEAEAAVSAARTALITDLFAELR